MQTNSFALMAWSEVLLLVGIYYWCMVLCCCTPLFNKN